MTHPRPEKSSDSFPPSSGTAYLIHAYEHRAYPLDESESFWIGRSSQCDIMVSEVFVSRHHAELRPDGTGYVVHPVGKTPTLLNDRPIESPHVLREGDVISIGTMRFVYTRERLPVAMQVADVWVREGRLYDEVSDRRPTLTFPVQTVGEGSEMRPETPMWVWVLLVVLVIGAIVYFGYQAMSGTVVS